MPKPNVIMSGAQTGADQGGLEAAVLLGKAPAGVIPRGNRTDAGPLSRHFIERWGVLEHAEPGYPPRTEFCVVNSHGTVIFGEVSSPGCSLTIKLCKKHSKPYLTNPTPEELKSWVDEHNIDVLNVAGNRERINPGIFDRTLTILLRAFGPKESTT